MPHSILPCASSGYALAGGTSLLQDASKGGEVGIYALEASGAATESTFEAPSDAPIFIDGVLKRNYLWRFTPVVGAAANTAVGDLPVLLYGTASSWPDNGITDTRALNDALSYISCHLGLIYDKSSRCYKPSFPNVRAEYCTDAVSDWNLAIQTPSPGT